MYAIAATLYKMITGVNPPEVTNRIYELGSSRKDILIPLSEYSKKIKHNQETVILNALNVSVKNRTKDMKTLLYELTTDKPVKRIRNKI